MNLLIWRKVWKWHLWLGIAVLAPLVFWLGTALVFALWPIESVRGKSLCTGRIRPASSLQGWMTPPPEALEYAISVVVRTVETHAVAIVDRNDQTEVWDLEAKKRIGSVLPLPWAREVARRDFSQTYSEDSVYLFPRSGLGRRVAGDGPETLKLPDEYAVHYLCMGFIFVRVACISTLMPLQAKFEPGAARFGVSTISHSVLTVWRLCQTAPNAP